jgi:hypothetical protein
MQVLILVGVAAFELRRIIKAAIAKPSAIRQQA